MSLHDVTEWMIGAIVFVIILIGIVYSYGAVQTEYGSVMSSCSNCTDFVATVDSAFSIMDYVIVITYVSFLLGAVVVSWFVRTHPVFFVFYMIGVLLLTFITYIYQNVLLEFTQAMPSFTVIYDTYPYTKFFIENLTMFVLVTSVGIGVILYAKPSISFARRF
jgi:hypothetical protein